MTDLLFGEFSRRRWSGRPNGKGDESMKKRGRMLLTLVLAMLLAVSGWTATKAGLRAESLDTAPASNDAEETQGNTDAADDNAEGEEPGNSAEADDLTQSDQECIDCEVASGCAWCQGENYDAAATPTVYKRATAICKMHKARVRPNNYYWNKLFYKLQEEHDMEEMERQKSKSNKVIC